MTQRLLNRKCRVTVAVGSPTPGDWFGTALQDTIVIEGFRVKFSCEKHLGKRPNEAKIVISNLAEATRRALKTRPLNVTLEVSYDDAPYAILFKGDIRHDESKHDKTDWLTELQIGDGDRAFANARVNASFRGGVTGKDAVAAIAGSMGLKMPSNVGEAKTMVTNIVSNGLSLSGPSEAAMSSILDPAGLGWSIQDEQLEVLGEDDLIDGNGVVTKNKGSTPAIAVSQDTGMVEVPDYSVPKALGKPPILKVKMLLEPRAKPGRLMQMNSTAVQGNFRIEDVKVNGDTHGHEWYTEIEAKEL